MKKILMGIIAAVMAAGCAKDNSEVIKVALVGPLTGDVAAMGQGMKRAIELAVREANESGSFGKVRIEAAVFDDRADPKEAVNVANRIISDPRIYGIVGHLNSGCSIPASQVYARRNMVMITPASTNPKLTLQGLPNVFRLCTTDNVQGPGAADYIFHTLKKTAVCALHDKTAYGQGIAENFKLRFEELGGKVVHFSGIDLGEKDFNGLLTSIKAKGPEVIYFGGMYTECALLSRQSKDMGLNVPMFSDDGSFTPEYVRMGGKSAEGDFFTMVGIPPEKLPMAKDFINNYRAQYPGADMQPYDAYTYEATRIILDAILRTGMDKSKMVEAVAGIQFSGILGSSSFDKNGDTVNKAISIYKVVDGKFVNVQ